MTVTGEATTREGASRPETVNMAAKSNTHILRLLNPSLSPRDAPAARPAIRRVRMTEESI